MLFRCNILALVGVVANSHYPSNKVLIWDDHQSRCIGEFTFRSKVHGVKLKRDQIVVGAVALFLGVLYLCLTYGLYVQEPTVVEDFLCKCFQKEIQPYAQFEQHPNQLRRWDHVTFYVNWVKEKYAAEMGLPNRSRASHHLLTYELHQAFKIGLNGCSLNWPMPKSN
ncbi:hypothetical protein VNO77_33870 [Canavalia gladiata]|uniref:Uncharacterized protein n=1 Tax=Canavalia gladiata TaxID=3824 RepID=A0AAN9KD83_CANGL